MITATRSPLHTALCDRLGIRHPICQAGMAFVARGSPALLREEIHRVRELTDRPCGVAILLATIRTSGRETEAFTDAIVEEAEAILRMLGRTLGARGEA
jgi:hypothetical protein